MSVNLVNGDTLNSDFTAICNAIRAKTGDANTIAYTPGDTSAITTAIGSISGGGGDLDGTLDGTVTSITSNVTSLIPYALYGITSLTTLNLPNVTDIGTCALQGCTNAKPTFGSPIKSVGGSGCRSLFSSNTSDTFEVTCDYATVSSDRSFAGSGVTKVLGTFMSIGTYVFEGCTKLVEAHYNLSALTYRQYNGCTALADLYLENPNGKVAWSSAEMQNVPTTCNIHVPDFLLSDYQADANWSTYNLVGMTTTETLYESMQSSGVGYVMTDVVPTVNTGFEVKFVNKSDFTNSANTYGTVFGRQYTATAQVLRLETYKATSYTGRLVVGNNKTVNADMYEDTTTVQTCSYDATNLTYTSPKGNTSTIATPTFGTSTLPIAIFANTTSSTAVGSQGKGMQIYYLKLYESGTLAHNFVPCKLTYQGDTTEVYAFKDTVTGKYYQFLGETPTVTLPS